MSGTLSKSDVRRIFSCLDQIRDLTDLLRRAHYTVPTNLVYGAASAGEMIRGMLLDAIVDDVAVEQIREIS